MPRYHPIDVPTAIPASESDMVAFHWKTEGIVADFAIPSDASNVLRVLFDKQCIVRLLDEMPISTEEDGGPSEGLVAEHFAYRVEGSAFADAQSSTWKQVCAPVSHWRFITGWACMDVLSNAAPTFSVVAHSVPGSA